MDKEDIATQLEKLEKRIKFDDDIFESQDFFLEFVFNRYFSL